MIKKARLLVLLLSLSALLQAQTYEYYRKFSFGAGPKGLTIKNDQLYVALYGAGKIIIANLDGTIQKEIKTTAKPYDVDCDAQGNLLIANRDAKTVNKIDLNGNILKSARFTEAVNGVTVRQNGEIYVATYSAVHIFDENLQKINTVTNLSTDKFREVRKVHFDTNDNMFFVDRNTGTLKINSINGNIAQVDYLIKKGNGSGTFNRMAYMTSTPKGDLIISTEETFSGSLMGLYRFSAHGTPAGHIGTLGESNEDNRFNSPNGISIDIEGNLYVADYNNNAIKIWKAFDRSAPQLNELSAQSYRRGEITLSFITDENCKVYYSLQAKNAPTPSAEQIKNGDFFETTTTNAITSQNIQVAQKGEMICYLIAVDKAGNESDILATNSFSIETELIIHNLFPLHKNGNNITLETQPNDAATLYWALTTIDKTAPTYDQIESGIDVLLTGQKILSGEKRETFEMNIPDNNRYMLYSFLKKGVEKSAITHTIVMPEQDIDKVRKRYFNLLTGNKPDYSDPLVLARYEALQANAAKARQKLDLYQWNDSLKEFDFKDRMPRDIVAGVLLPLAINYHLEGPADKRNPDFQNPLALKEITDLYVYLEKRGFKKGCNIKFLSSGPFLGMCGYFYASVLMREELLRNKMWETVESTMDWTSREVNPEDPYWAAEVEHNDSRSDGVRTLYNYRLIAICTQTENNLTREAEMAYLQKALNQNLRIAPAWDGFIKPDFTGYHHRGPWGNAYNIDALVTASQMALMLHDTQYALNEESRQNLAESLLAFRTYCGKYDISRGMCGRFPNQLTALISNMPAFAYLYETLGEEMQKRIGGAFTRLYDTNYSAVIQNLVRGVTCDISFQGGMGTLQQMNKVSSLGLDDKEIESLNRTFPYAAMQIHRRGEWMAAIKSFNKYVWDFETNQEQNWLGRNQSAGALSLYATPNAEGVVTAEASGVGYNGWDWCHVPGTTVFDMPIDSIVREATLYPMSKFSPNDYAGGVTLEGKNGVYGIIYNDIRQAYNYNGNLWGTKWKGVTLSANKSWFFFDDEIVALGSAIKNTHTHFEAHTTLFQNSLQNELTPIFVNGEAQSGLGYTADFNEQIGIALTDAVGNGYLIPDANGLHIHRLEQNSKQDRNYNNSTKGNYATAWIDHGKSNNGKYHYLIYPGGADKVKAMSHVPTLPYNIQQQNEQAHIVSYPKKQLKGYALFKSGTIENDTLIAGVDTPCLIMLREHSDGTLTFSLSNPELGFLPKNKFPYQVWSIDKEILFAESKEQPVVVDLKGEWHITNSNPALTSLGYDAKTDITTLRFSAKDAVSIEAKLGRNATAIDKTGVEKITYGPNPFSNSLRLRFNKADSHHVALIDITGRIVLQQTHSGSETRISTSAIQTGTYLLQIDGEIYGKVMKGI